MNTKQVTVKRPANRNERKGKRNPRKRPTTNVPNIQGPNKPSKLGFKLLRNINNY
jgi:hypothetical protein